MSRAWITLLTIGWLTACTNDNGGEPPNSAAAPGLTGIRFLADGEAQGFERATEVREFVFPGDHGSHPGFRTEWWYFTGNLFTTDERHYGFELTFFRLALSASAASRQSPWASNQMWMANFALTDTTNGRFTAAERFSRGALQLAGAKPAPTKIWVEDWSVAETADGSLQLLAQDGETELVLQLSGLERIVRQGDAGLDQKGPEPGNASYYYSAPRLRATGSVRTGADAADSVDGYVWMDREWGTSALSDGVAGWDWFALQLDDGSDLMFYRLRQADGEMSPFSTGSITSSAGASQRLSSTDVELEVTERWQSPASKITYPIAWRIRIPRLTLTLEIEPYLPNQEINLSVRYWEGAVRVRGQRSESPIYGNGYLELAGY